MSLIIKVKLLKKILLLEGKRILTTGSVIALVLSWACKWGKVKAFKAKVSEMNNPVINRDMRNDFHFL